MGYDWETLEGCIRIKLAENIIKESMPSFDGITILDVGCRVGNFTKYMLKLGAKVTGIDIDDQALLEARYNNQDANIIYADVNKYNTKDKYDMIFIKDVIEHVDNPQLLINRMSTMQNKGGRIIIGTQNSFSLTYLIDGLYTFLSGNVWRGYDPDHKHFFNPWKFKRILGESGYKIIKYYSTYHIPYRSINMRLFGTYGDNQIYHGIDRLNLNDKWPFNITGWWICVVAEKI